MRLYNAARLSGIALVLTFICPRVARADVADSAAAQALFDQARHLMKQGHYEAACPKLKESQRLDPGSGTLINLANCYAHEGKTATAWSTFLEAAAASHRVGNAPREQAARARAAALKPKLSQLIVNVAAPARVKGLALTRDGVPIDPPMWGAPVPTDPGKHTIIATAPGYKTWQTVVTVKHGPADLTVDVPPLQKAAGAASTTPPATTTAAPTPSAPTTSPAPPPATADQTPSAGGGLGTQRTLALVAGGLGVVGVGVGTAFGLVSKSKHDQAASHCNGSLCRDQTGVDLKSQARSAGNISTVGFIVGGIGLAAAVTLWLTAGPKHTEVGLAPNGVSVRGEW